MQLLFETLHRLWRWAAWAAYDVLHVRQLVELKWQYLVEAVEPYGVEYAGEW